MIEILIYLLIGVVLSRGSWVFFCARRGAWEMNGSQPLFFFGALLWPAALIGSALLYGLLFPLFRLIDKLALRLANFSHRSDK